MKKFSFLALAAAGMLFAACSSDKDVAENVAINGNGDGYVGISISIPSSQTSTRANDDLVNGKQDEFTVKNGYLYLFKGGSEAGATFLRRYPITQNFDNDKQGEKDTPEAQTGVTLPSGTAITSTAVAVCKIDKLDLGADNLYAFVVINAQGDLAAEPAVGTPFSKFSVKELDADDNGGTLEGIIGDNGLLMTNSPISNKKGGDAAPSGEELTTLVLLDKTAIKNTAAEAEAAPAGCIYVERAAAKVTVTDAISGTKQIEMGTGKYLAYTIDGWQVINTEPKFYNARQILSDWDGLQSQYWTGHNNSFRFISMYKFDPQIPDGGTHFEGYRTYFAKDLQYNADATLDYTVAGGKVIGTTTDRAWLTTTDRAFVPENTFDVDRQQRKNTTQVTLRLKFNDGTDFYTISNDVNYYLAATINNSLAAKVEVLYNVDKFKNDLVAALAAAGKTATVGITATVNTSDTGKDNLGYVVAYTITGATFDDITDETTKSALETAWTAAKAEAEAAFTVALYKGGLSYYNIRIQHFGEKETPWAAARATQPGETIEQIYGPVGTRTADYLGRYGVVRDNWYNLSIDGVAKLGSAEPKPVNGDPTPDDEIEEEHYISAHVHILPWVLRTQHVNF